MIIRLIMSSLMSILVSASSLSADLFYGKSSCNFVQRWAFQHLCDFAFDPRTVWPTDTTKLVTFNPHQVKAGDMVFVRDAPQFFKKMHEAIPVPYFIMTHGEYLDKFIPTYFNYLNDPKILGWFTIHPCSESHERVFALPLGIIQYKELYVDREAKSRQFEQLRNKEKKRLLYMNFTDWGNARRKKIRQIFTGKPFCKAGSLAHFGPYITELSNYKFVLSPPGLGPDCYRVWESLLMGTVPIVQHSPIDWLYEGLPVLFINEWEEVTEEFLHKKYEEIRAKKYSCEKLYMEYWIEKIDQIKKRCWDRFLLLKKESGKH
ncbi:hypothetical protein H0X06_05160 [Candidatus Dependentiae bacterium]|nr:hypothetical protein [Candidatus Dependentiae bacterium]